MLRAVTLAFAPLPYTFCTALCFYLLFWSLGVYLARSLTADLSVSLGAAALSIVFMSVVSEQPVSGLLGGPAGIVLFSALYSLPCLAFGALFGQLVSKVAVRWGNDVGRFYAWNTLGSCAGILCTVLLGYEFHPAYLAWAIAFGYLALIPGWRRGRLALPLGGREREALRLVCALTFGVWIGHAPTLLVRQYGASIDSTKDQAYYGREGVVEVRNGVQMVWNGLWHSQLSRGDHAGTNNWMQAVVPLVSHPGSSNLDTLVVGLATGITAATLAGSKSVRSVDAYEINPGLSRLFRDYPDGTLRVSANKKVTILWQDARAGLSLNEKQYDLITQAPLYLKQAGSSILLSREYFRLVRKRLKPGGVFSIYSNSFGNEGQALLVRRTARDVFPYGESFSKGYLLVVSDSPLEFSARSIIQKTSSPTGQDPTADEIRTYGISKLAAYRDDPPLDWDGGRLMITDDHPLVEYPALASWLVGRERAGRAP